MFLEIFRQYTRRLRDASALDFDDLIAETVYLFRAFPKVASLYQRRFRHILVDEYQDTNHAQYSLIRELTQSVPADREYVLVLLGQQLQEAVLGGVRVLVLVDEDVPERPLPPFAGLGEALEHLDGQHEDVVEVDGVRAEEPALVQLVDLGDRLVPERRDPRGVLVRRDQLVLRVRDLRVDPTRREALRILAQLFEARLNEAHLVGLVEIVKFERYPSRSASRRSMRPQAA